MTLALKPRQPVPELIVDTLANTGWNLADTTPPNFSLILFYRGMHCPMCRQHLQELEPMVGAFAERGTEVIAISADSRERALQTRQDLGLAHLLLGYGMDIATARTWGLHISTSRGQTSINIEEPRLFSEPGLFIVRRDKTLYWSSVSSMPFARPHFDDVLAGIDFVLRTGYPARGEE